MAKIFHRFTGFLWAILIAIISFFIIFIFFPDVSNKFFGVSLKEPKKLVQSIESGIDSAKDTITEKVPQAAEKVVEGVIDKIGDVVSRDK
ncbi:MAG: hypothetical protein ACTTJW_01470 [Sphaerochaeta sp.]